MLDVELVARSWPVISESAASLAVDSWENRLGTQVRLSLSGPISLTPMAVPSPYERADEGPDFDPTALLGAWLLT